MVVFQLHDSAERQKPKTISSIFDTKVVKMFFSNERILRVGKKNPVFDTLKENE